MKTLWMIVALTPLSSCALPARFCGAVISESALLARVKEESVGLSAPEKIKATRQGCGYLVDYDPSNPYSLQLETDASGNVTALIKR